MIDVDRAWHRVTQRNPGILQKWSRDDFGFQAIPFKVAALASTEVRDNQQVKFSNGAIVMGITAGAQINGQAGTVAYRPGLDLFACSIAFQQQRTILGPDRTIGSSAFGTGQFCQFPDQELYCEPQQLFLYSVENLTTSIVDVWFTHHCLVPVNVG